ncbi:PepSY-associated TM helix domain-containing protein [Pseudomonas berkeleyensis]|uniref:PepSY domain-containing protein n=1 Tax=Pseudomonas berkeleyensis TaxID=2726956 RepID=A0A7G5DNP9_9PSED|nr:PepSY-associated TM helix domain-containing protein [Pseudomonas berkeleyensis]QMV63374.1 PepSY domain-containing protein [Pseudomonas berkeleyensis]WSO38835.1 PepSY-associated TM helix domain-containing protein [Pseudomonas berkeleyensis]
MRPILVLLHRWCGLFIALFLFTAGLTGAVISWDHELDEWLNPHLFDAQSAGPAQDPLQLVDALEARDPRLQVSFMPLALEPGHALGIFVDPRIDPATGKAYKLGFNQLGVDPVTGDIQGQREWGAISLSRENLLPFLYKLHYSLHIPEGFGIELGVLFFGIVALVWCLDCLVALWLSFPNLRSWRKSFAFRWRQGGYKLNFDLHRSGGVWVWLLLLILAVTSVSMNLERQVVRPLVELFSPLTPSPFASRTPVTLDEQIVPQLDRRQAIAVASAEARRLGWQAPPGGLFHSAEFGVYGVGFYAPGDDHGSAGLGNPWIYVDSRSGELAGAHVPGTGSAGDIFLQAQFPLHSGRIIGLPGRILVSLLGLVVAGLSLTGLVIWAKKRRSRVLADQRSRAASQAMA